MGQQHRCVLFCFVVGHILVILLIYEFEPLLFAMMELKLVRHLTFSTMHLIKCV